MEIFPRQVRVAARGLTRAPGFTLTATLTLALGIGLSTAVFTVADALLLRALPVGDQDRLVVLWGETRDGQFSNFPLALDDVRAFEGRARSLGDVAFFEFRGAIATPVRAGDRVHSMNSALVSGNFFDVLRSPPALGRALRPEDDVAGAAPVIVLSHRAWRRQFGGDSTIIGRSVVMVATGRSYTVVGVMRQGLEYPRGADAWIPIIAHGAASGSLDIVTNEVDVLARLRPGATPAEARAELTSFFGQPGAPVWHRGVRGVVHTLPDIVLGDTKPALLAVALAAALLLFITCVNVANLVLVRSLRRAREFAVRAALGANRGRIAGQLLGESALLSCAGGLMGIGCAVAAVRAFVAFAPASFPRIDEIGINGTVLAAAVLITAATLLLSGLAPALFMSRADANQALRSGSHHSGGRRIRIAAEALVVAQVALAAVSLTGAALMTRSLINLVRVDLSFEPARLLVASLALRQDPGDSPDRWTAEIEQMLPRLEAVPGVRQVSPVITVPFSGTGGGIDGRISIPGQSEQDAAGSPMLNMEIVAPDYFSTLGVALLRGRPFSDDDREGSMPVVIVSSSTARHFWPASDPIGQQVRVPGGVATVVGVVPDTRYRELRTARPSIYFPLGQSHFPVVPDVLLVRTAGPPLDVVSALRNAIEQTSPGITLATASPLETLVEAPRAQPRLNAMVLVLFAAAALALSAIGLFAVVATMVRQRTHEIGIRLALGATAADVRRMIMVRGLAVAAIGSAIGIAGALVTSRMLSTLLFGISPTDGVTLGGVVALMLGVAAIATAVPARSTMRIDPIIALRNDS